jgi:hypothetical protein
MTLSLDRMFLIPPEHHIGDTDRTAAKQILDCTDDTLDELVHNGLTNSDDRYDSRDLFNLGLHSGTGRTVPEQAFAFTLRWMRATTEDLLASRTSRFSLTLSCDCETATLAAPRCDLYNGEVRDEVTTDTSRTATIRTEGSLATLASPELRDLVREFAALGIRWVKLPDALRDNEDLLTEHRVATCESASRYLARRCAETGFEATTRIGWVIGMLDLVHAWVEVTDADGETKIVDPVFGLFATTVTNANPLLTDPTIALRTNRLIPTDLPVGGRVAHHNCDAPLTTKIRQVKEEA